MLSGKPVFADTIPFFPLPLWLVALILFVIVAAVGGALYLESQQKNPQSSSTIKGVIRPGTG